MFDLTHATLPVSKLHLLELLCEYQCRKELMLTDILILLRLSGWRPGVCVPLIDVEVEWSLSGYMALTALP